MYTKTRPLAALRLLFIVLVLAGVLPVAAWPDQARPAGPPVAAQPVPPGWHSLTGRMRSGTSTGYPLFSSDSAYLVYIADDRQPNVYELYSVPLSGTLPTRLNPPLAVEGSVYGFAITPDNQYVIFAAAVEAAGRPDLYRVPIGGGEAVRLNSDPDAGRNVREFRVDPDNGYVAYTAEQTVPDQFEVFSVPLSGGFAPRLNPNLVPGGDVIRFEIDRYKDRVVYLADQSVNDYPELFSAPLAGSVAAVPLSPSNAMVTDFQVDPEIQLVVMQTQASGEGRRLYGNATTGGLLYPLTPDLGDNEDVRAFRFSPDGARVVFNVRPRTPETDYGTLYSVLIGGGAVVPLSLTNPGAGVSGYQYYLTPDSQRVIYFYESDDEQPAALFSAALDGSDWDVLFADAAADQPIQLSISPDSAWLVYVTISLQLYRVPVTGGLPEPLGTGYDPVFLPDSSGVVVHRADAQWRTDLFSVPLAGGQATNLSRSKHEVGVSAVRVSPNGQWVIYTAYYYASDEIELRASDGSEALAMVYLPMISR